MSDWIYNRSKQILVLFNDAFLISISLLLSYIIRLDTVSLDNFKHQIIISLPIILGVRLTVFTLSGLYRGMWRFVGIRDLITLVRAITVSSVISVVILFLVYRLESYPRSVFVIDWFVLLILLGGSRFTYRLYREGWFNRSIGNLKKKGLGTRILIVGAGKAGESMLREIINNPHYGFVPIGFVDDARVKHNSTIHGVRVLGNTRMIPKIVKEYSIEEIFLAIPSVSARAKRRIMHLCKRTGVKFKTLPAMGQLLNGTVTVSALREFQIDDLLGREPVKLDETAIGEYLQDKTVMITGAGGSIGSELCCQVAAYAPKRLVLFERSEFNLYQIQMRLHEHFPQLELHAIIGDVLNKHRTQLIMKEFKPDVVFHAAAYKHVPLMEQNAEEAIRNNVFGTWIVAHQAHLMNVKKFVMVSTDKAVRPTNIMGASKRMAELVCQGLSLESRTQFVTVRFGNVLNSVGSVIPLFKRQIAKGGPVTVTHPEIYRYFMTIPESVQLIMQAGAMGRGGEIFLLDMGEPVKIVDLARDMITLSGLVPDKDIKIVYTGLRPGEKLFEELLTAGEEITSTLHKKIKVAAAEKVDLKILARQISELLDSLQDGFSMNTVEAIKGIVPDFQPELGGPNARTAFFSGNNRAGYDPMEQKKQNAVHTTDKIL